jgi:hypothetical protein
MKSTVVERQHYTNHETSLVNTHLPEVTVYVTKKHLIVYSMVGGEVI